VLGVRLSAALLSHAIGLSFAATTGCAIYEFPRLRLDDSCGFYSHLFVFFTTCGIPPPPRCWRSITQSCVFMAPVLALLPIGRLQFTGGFMDARAGPRAAYADAASPERWSGRSSR